MLLPVRCGEAAPARVGSSMEVSKAGRDTKHRAAAPKTQFEPVTHVPRLPSSQQPHVHSLAAGVLARAALLLGTPAAPCAWCC